MDENKTDKIVELNTVESEQVVGGTEFVTGGTPGHMGGGFGSPLGGGSGAPGTLPGVTTTTHHTPLVTRR